MMFPRRLLNALGLACFTTMTTHMPGQAATIRVPMDQPTIQAGIDAAALMDSVLVAPGTYAGPGNVNLDFDGKDIVLLSEAGSPTTIIDGEGISRGFHFHSGESNLAVVEGFTVTRCVGPTPGGGMKCESSSSPTVVACRFTENFAEFSGGVDCLGSGSSPTFLRCFFDHNDAADCGGGMSSAGGAAPVLTECMFSENRAGGCGDGFGGAALYIVNASAEITRCTFSETGDIAIRASSSPSLTGCTLYNTTINLAFSTGATTIHNTIIAFSSGRAITCFADENVVLTCCDLFGNAGGDWVGCIAGQAGQNGNISADPRFCDAPAGDFTLHGDSPCAPEQSGCGLIGAWPVACGATAIEPATWGRIKTVFGR